jgi:hypothetical protein
MDRATPMRFGKRSGGRDAAKASAIARAHGKPVGAGLLTLVAFAAFTFLGSTLTRSALAAAGIGFVAFAISATLGNLPIVGAYMPGSHGTLGPDSAACLPGRSPCGLGGLDAGRARLSGDVLGL